MPARFARFRLELVLIPLLALVAWGAYRTNLALESLRVERAATGDVGPLPDGKIVALLSLGFERLVADLFWIRTVSYVGDEASADADWPAAERLAMLVTDVDPHFDTVYVVMSSVLNGLRSDPDAAIRLLEKGTEYSHYWRVYFMLGFQYFIEKQDYVRGAQALQRALDLGGPPYLQFLVTRLYSNAGDANTAMAFIQARLQNEETPEIRAKLEKRFSDLWINRDLKQIDDAADAFQAARKRAPKSVRELVDTGFLARAPRDPKGGEYFIDNGVASSHVPYEPLRINQQRIH
jgi:hypothetical protein